MKGPLKYKFKNGNEITFGSNAVQTAQLKWHAPLHRPPKPARWSVDVNGKQVCLGTERQARTAYERALKYIR